MNTTITTRKQFQPECRATAIGSMPHSDAARACSALLKYLPDIPVWPQLPHLSPRENMYLQFSEGFPGFSFDGEHFYVQRSPALDEDMEKLYQASLDNNYDSWKVSPGYAAGLYKFIEEANAGNCLALKGQVTGPVSWGLTVTDKDHLPIIYDDTLSDAVARHLALKAAWEERFLTRGSKFNIIFVDEPYMSSFGSAFVSLTREKVTGLLEEVYKGITCLKGLHCCGNTDW
ncbi:MAG: methionine synthase, partial [Dehalococcoidia bacterium]|nr:methionine synthase [Dehalococcoidia bacterium]